MPAWIQRILRLELASVALAGLGVGLLANILVQQEQPSLPLVIAAILALVVAALLRILRRRKVRIQFTQAVAIRTPEESRINARRGFAGFVSIYAPRAGSAARLSPEERIRAAENLDFDSLSIEDSNLQPIVEAILSHASRLEHCWLIATEAQSGFGSLPYARFLVKYLQLVKGMNCIFHYGADYVVPVDDDVLILHRTYDTVSRIFKEAEILGLTSEEIVTDVTSGLRTMMIGAVLACLNRGSDVEVAGFAYDSLGRQIGPSAPLIFGFKVPFDT
jgi:hypothetical protein